MNMKKRFSGIILKNSHLGQVLAQFV